MSRTEILRLMRRFLVLVVLTVGLLFAATGLENKAGAAICCSQCYINFDNCLNNCNDDPGCVQGCNNTLNHCVQFCNSGC